MKKILEIRGCKTHVVIEKCYGCPLNHDNGDGADFCKHPENNGVLGCFDKCPLPNAPEETDEWPNDENHRLGPNGERLIAVGFKGCNKCVFDVGQCNYSSSSYRCSPGYRKDGRNIHWELAGDRK